MEETYELTEEQYQISAQHGIHRRLAYERFNKGWELEDAITKPLGNQGIIKKLQAKARANGIEISRGAIQSRRQLKWSEEDIVTTPVNGTRNKNKGYLERALRNGIGQSTYYGRLRLGWSRERACTDEVQMQFSKNKKLG